MFFGAVEQRKQEALKFDFCGVIEAHIPLWCLLYVMQFLTLRKN